MAFMVIYCILAYWAAGKTIYANKIMIGTWNGIFFKKLFTGVLLGIVLIPVAIIKTIFGG